MSVKTELKLAYLKDTKNLIKNAIIEKGQDVSDSDTFRSYADKILAIAGGGESDTGVTINLDRLTVVLPITDITVPDGTDGMVPMMQPLGTEAGNIYLIVWNNVGYICEAQAAEFQGVPVIAIGNLASLGGENTGEPFAIGEFPPEVAEQTGGVYGGIIPLDGSTSFSAGGYFIGENSSETILEDHPVALDFRNGNQTITAPDGYLVKSAIIQMPENLVPENIPIGITIAGVEGARPESSGESSDLVKYVTFMNGDKEEYRMPVLNGDDCKNPITTGAIFTPTKESTAQYDYTHSGWALTDGGSASSSALSAVTEDRVVYAAYTSSLRSYTIKFYDGATLKGTKTYNYGEIPSYTVQKEGYVFDCWSPEIVAVTGDASYYAVWSEIITFADGTWEDIARIAESGQAAQYFAIGDSKTFKDKANSTNMTVKIIGFNHDNLADGTGKAGITVACDFVYGASIKPDFKSASQPGWQYHEARTTVAPGFLNYIPTGLSSVIKSVRKEQQCGDVIGYTNDKVFIFNMTEYGFSEWQDGGETYAGFAGNSPIVYKTVSSQVNGSGSKTRFLLRSYRAGEETMKIYQNGAIFAGNSGEKYGIRFGFCI